jgi:adenine C2-methylase RlmN of 23S rRNA A2503 and tRNA A37
LLSQALHLLTSEQEGLGIAQRRISVSTVGVVPAIRRLTEEFPQVNLAFSLHSPFHEQRNELVPLNRSHPFPAVFDALDHHIEVTRRKVSPSLLTQNKRCEKQKERNKKERKLRSTQRNEVLLCER